MIVYTDVAAPKLRTYAVIIDLICIVSGLYLTLVGPYLRYQQPYRYQRVAIEAPRGQGIYVEADLAVGLNDVYRYISAHTGSNDYVFVYSYSPILYFFLERPNPSRYSIYYPGYLTAKEEVATVGDIKAHRVRYVIDDGFDTQSTPLANWVKQQQKVFSSGFYTVYRVR
jgi:hypothetical protein